MAVQNIIKAVAGSIQTAVGGTGAEGLLPEWTNADGWIAIVELTVEAHGVTSGSCDAFYRREVFKWNDGGAAPADLGALVATTEVKEDAAWNAVLALNVNSIEIQLTGDAAELVTFSWAGTIRLQQVI
jgi:hypothetical protein